jgi:diguanylate cyclase (GGDEF)-like protein/putative nucleotidyltransferase with HDIG domain
MRTAGLPWRHGMALLLCAAGLAALLRAVLSKQPLWDVPLLFSAVFATGLLRRRHTPACDAEDGWGATVAPAHASLVDPGPGATPPRDARAWVNKLRRVNELNSSVIVSLAMAIDARGCDPHSHVYHVREYAVALAERLHLSPEELEAVKIAALLHDIGKLGVPEHILGKPGKLTSDEFEIIKSHVTVGALILEPVRFPWPVVPIVLSHHERWDGNGYPNGLSGEAIPIGGRIVALADVFDALTSTRPYRTAMPREKAIEFIRGGSGTQFDPRVVEAFIAILPEVETRIRRAEQVEEMGRRGAHAERSRGTRREAVGCGLATGRPEDRPTGRVGGRPPGATRALEQIARANEEMIALCELTDLIAARPELGPTLERVAPIVARLVPYTTLALFLRDESGERLAPAHVTGAGSALFEGMTIAPGDGATGWVVEQNEAVINALPMLDVDGRCRPGDGFPLGAALSVPLRADGQVIGALTLYHAEREAFQPCHLRRLTRVAETVGPALESARQFARTRQLALEDSLTRLPNARALMHVLRRESAQADRSGRGYAVLMLDLDHFKWINDYLGHLEGDAVLERVAAALRERVRPMDYVARYAGDEFVVVLPGAAEAAAADVADRIRTAFDRFPADAVPMPVGVSIGIALYPRDGRAPRELLGVADARMYQDKAERKRRLLGGAPE